MPKLLTKTIEKEPIKSPKRNFIPPRRQNKRFILPCLFFAQKQKKGPKVDQKSVSQVRLPIKEKPKTEQKTIHSN